MQATLNETHVKDVAQERWNAETERLADEKAAWMDRVAKHFFPERIYELGRSRKRAKYVANWIADNGYEIREVPSELLTQFCKTTDGQPTVLAEFRIELRGRKT